MKFEIYHGNPRTDKQSKKIKTVDTWDEASNELARLRHEMKTDEIYIKEVTDKHESKR